MVRIFIELPDGTLVDKRVVGEVRREDGEYYEVSGSLIPKRLCSEIKR